MVRITIDAELSEKLRTADEGTELCDPSGRVVARITPIAPSADETNSHGIEDPWALFPELTEEEIERRCNSDEPGLSTAEVKAYLMNRSKRR